MEKVEFKFDTSKFEADKLIAAAQKELSISGNNIDDFTRINDLAIKKYNTIFDELNSQKNKFEYELDNTPLKREEYIDANNRLKATYKEAISSANKNISNISKAMYNKFLTYIKATYKVDNKLAKLLLDEVTKDNYIDDYGFTAADEKVRSFLEFYRKADKLGNS